MKRSYWYFPGFKPTDLCTRNDALIITKYDVKQKKLKKDCPYGHRVSGKRKKHNFDVLTRNKYHNVGCEQGYQIMSLTQFLNWYRKINTVAFFFKFNKCWQMFPNAHNRIKTELWVYSNVCERWWGQNVAFIWSRLHAEAMMQM